MKKTWSKMALKGFKCILNTTFFMGYPGTPIDYLGMLFWDTLMGISRVCFFLRRPLNSLQLILVLVPHFFYIRQSCIVLVSKRKWFIKVSGAICNPHWSFSLSLTLWVQVLLCGKMNYKGPFGLEINCAEYCLFITNSYESQRTEPSPGTAGHC